MSEEYKQKIYCDGTHCNGCDAPCDDVNHIIRNTVRRGENPGISLAPKSRPPQPTTMEPSHPDTLRERFIDAITFEGTPIIDSHAEQVILGFISQEKERWENELREKIDGIKDKSETVISYKDNSTLFYSEIWNNSLEAVLALLTTHKPS